MQEQTPEGLLVTTANPLTFGVWLVFTTVLACVAAWFCFKSQTYHSCRTSGVILLQIAVYKAIRERTDTTGVQI